MRRLIALVLLALAWGSVLNGSAEAQLSCGEGQRIQGCRCDMRNVGGYCLDPRKARDCQPGQNTATGCRCAAPLVLLPAGRCDRPIQRGARCLEAQNIDQSGCVCTRPLMRSTTGLCIRCLPGDGDRVVNGLCQVATQKRR